VITFNITYDAYRALNALLDAGVYTSRSEALRAAVNLLMFVHDKKITVNDK
jgi:Arc/MetJ-type ribon-helix-helix transcriptional regulator